MPLQVAGAFLLLLVAGVVASTWQAIRATLAERTAETVSTRPTTQGNRPRRGVTSWRVLTRTCGAPTTWRK